MSDETSGIDWSRYVIAVVGGDEREQEIARLAATTGARVRAYGFPWPQAGIPGVEHTGTAADALAGAHFALFPIPGIAPNGALFAPEAPEAIVPEHAMLSEMQPNAHIILGWADEKLKAHAQALGITLHEYEWDEDLMLLRGPAIVEGLLKVLIENTRITIHKARIGIVGQGTIGFLLTRYMVALGARVHVFARNPVQRAAAHAANAEAHSLNDLEQMAGELDILLSTVPVRLIGENVLRKLPAGAVSIDLAAPPGCVDVDAAKALGIKAIWARGLGRRAPVTVGGSQWGGVRLRIENIIRGSK